MTARFIRMQFDGLHSEKRVFVANNHDDVLTLLENGHIIAQEAFPLVIPNSGVAFVKLLWQYYPEIVTYEEIESLFPTARTQRMPRYHTSEVSKRLEPFGITIASRRHRGYELRPLDVSITRDMQRFQDILLPGIVDDDLTLTLNHKGALQHNGRILTLLQGAAIVEQCFLPPLSYSLFQLFLESDRRGIDRKDLVMHHYGVKERQATKWLEDAKKSRVARHELMKLPWLSITRLRDTLRPFGIDIETIRGYGYAFGRVLRIKARERARL